MDKKERRWRLTQHILIAIIFAIGTAGVFVNEYTGVFVSRGLFRQAIGVTWLLLFIAMFWLFALHAESSALYWWLERQHRVAREERERSKR